jgi:ankyrin repeat protein
MVQSKAKRLRRRSLILRILAVLLLLVPSAQANAQSDDLFNAAGKGDLARVKTLLANGADINAKSHNGGTALIWASYFGKPEVVQALIDKGADVNARDTGGQTALFLASQEDHLIIVQALLAKNADPDISTDKAETALTIAAQNGEVVSIREITTAKQHCRSRPSAATRRR